MRPRPSWLWSVRGRYRPFAFVLIGAIAAGSYAAVLRFPDGSIPRWVLEARRAAVRTVEGGQDAIRKERRALHLALAPADRGTGMVGVISSPITTELGSAAAKRTSTDPLFAAAVVDMLASAGVRRGDAVALGMSGSFPSLNLAAMSAVESMGATPLSISSIGSSQFGANEVDLSWPAMEAALVRRGVLRHRSLAIAPGGTEIGSLSSPEDLFRRKLAETFGMPVIPLIPLRQEIAHRMDLYRRAASARGIRIAAFVNVGAASADVGAGRAGEDVILPGLSRPAWSAYTASRLGVVGQMAVAGVPIVHLLDVARLAHRYGIPWDPSHRPHRTDLPGPPPNPLAVGGALVGLITLVALGHALGWFRVPSWELPPALREKWRLPPFTRDEAEAGARAIR